MSYAKPYQETFIRELEEGNLERALETLESIPIAKNKDDAVKRLTVITQGYQAIIGQYQKLIEEKNEELSNKNQRNKREEGYSVEQATTV